MPNQIVTVTGIHVFSATLSEEKLQPRHHSARQGLNEDGDFSRSVRVEIPKKRLQAPDIVDQIVAEPTEEMRESLKNLLVHFRGSRISETMICESLKAMAS